MPDAWEYPWFAAWDLAFHATTFAIIDPAFAKHQLELLVMEWYQHPNGQIPAYEWDFSNINPPVHAWAAWQVFQTEQEIYGVADVEFLDRVFAKLGQNFTWWVNKVDAQGNNIFEGGFLGMDNIRIIDRDAEGQPHRAGGRQRLGGDVLPEHAADRRRAGRAAAAVRRTARAYRYNDAARKYLQHFMYICDAMNRIGTTGCGTRRRVSSWTAPTGSAGCRCSPWWGSCRCSPSRRSPSRSRDPESFYELFGFLRWFARNRRDLVADNAHLNLEELHRAGAPAGPRPPSCAGSVAIVNEDKLVRVLERMLDPAQFLSSHGIRGLSKYHLDHNEVDLPGSGRLEVFYEPAESIRMMRMGGNSNWCGPVWMPVNYLLVESLRKFHRLVGPGVHGRRPDRVGATGARSTRSPTISRRGSSGSSCAMPTPAGGRSSAASTCTTTTRCGGTTCSSTSTSTAATVTTGTPARDWGEPPDRLDRTRRQPHPGARRPPSRRGIGHRRGLTGQKASPAMPGFVRCHARTAAERPECGMSERSSVVRFVTGFYRHRIPPLTNAKFSNSDCRLLFVCAENLIRVM